MKLQNKRYTVNFLPHIKRSELICKRCGRELEYPKKTRGLFCNLRCRNNYFTNENRRISAELGKCSDCYYNKVKKDKKMCEACLEKRRKYKREKNTMVE